MSSPGHDVPLIGRDAELRSLSAALEIDGATVALTGPPGVGKTRLLEELLRERAGRGASLEAAETLTEGLEALARALGTAASLEAISRFLAGARVELLWLDGVDRCGPVALELIDGFRARLPALRVLVASRAPVLSTERTLTLAPLEVPTGEAEGATAAEHLWERCAQRMRERYTIAGDDPGAVGALLRRLDGLPLAIELAAAQLDLLSTRELLAHLDGLLADGATHGAGGMEAAFDLSWSLLDEAARSTLCQLSVFEGPFTFDASQAVCGEGARPAHVLRALRSLRSHGMLEPAPRAPDGPLWLRPYTTVRAYARARLSAEARDAAERRHGRYFAAFADRLRGPSIDEALAERLQAHEADLAAACERAIERRDPDLALRLLVAMRPVVARRGARAWVVPAARRVLELGPTDRGLALLMEGVFARYQGDLAAAARALDEAAFVGDELIALDARSSRAFVSRLSGALVEARERYEPILALLDGGAASEAHTNYALVLHELGELDEAADAYERAERTHRQTGATRSRVITLVDLARLRWDLGDFELALGDATEACREAERLGDLRVEAGVRGILAGLALERGRTDEARDHAERAASAAARCADPAALVMAHLYQSCVALEARISRDARRHSRETVALAEAMDDVWGRRAGLAVGALAALRRGRASEAARRIEAAEQGPTEEEPTLRWVAGTLRLALDVVGGPSPGDGAARDALSARLTSSEPIPAQSAFARWFCRGLAPIAPEERDAIVQFVATRPPPGGLRMDRRGHELTLGDSAIHLGRRPTLARLLVALAEHRLERPGELLSSEVLLERGWPAERILPHAAKNRLRVSIARLRKAGFGELLESEPGGYRLSPKLALHRADD